MRYLGALRWRLARRGTDPRSELRAHLSRQGTPIGPNDLMIAAITMTHDLVLVTNNTREFSRIPNLKLEDWEI
jgi:tRNA(fMet)-specific endonuclease VapC